MKAIKNVDGCYVKDVGVPEKRILPEQMERCFAYELYHQWSLVLNPGNEKPSKPDSPRLYLNAEIVKYINGQKTFPDLVVHGGQSDLKNQAFICEIKRSLGLNTPDSVRILGDLKKLSDYLNLSLDALICQFNQAAFIVTNITLENLKNRVRIALDPRKKKDKSKKIIEEIKLNANRITCISYNPEPHSRGNIEPRYFLLSDLA